jgi:sterol desaturase/sphingolipid hydroxylase (fatty acid hydroxylase superfamily)
MKIKLDWQRAFRALLSFAMWPLLIVAGSTALLIAMSGPNLRWEALAQLVFVKLSVIALLALALLLIVAAVDFVSLWARLTRRAR